MLRQFEDFLHKFSAFLIFFVGALIFGNVVARALFRTQIPDTIIIVPELMVAMILFPLAAVTRDRSHIVVELVSRKMPRQAQGWLVVFGSLIGLIAIGILLYAGIHDLEKVISRQSQFAGDLELPKWPGVAAYVAGLAFCAVRLVLMLLQDGLACLRGDVDDLIAPHDTADDIEDKEQV
ncbi:MAG: TRAP transporter small permease [Marinibacterium sp.]|nr:TRAP transporter small permease [Marinibacterium sp.]